MNSFRLSSALAAALIVPAAGGALAAAPRLPNVVVILADDLGYGDVSANGQGAIQTPAIDALARQGVRMTAAYAAASTCTPSRYAMLTGEYPWRKPGTGILPGDAALIISPSRPTLARIFKDGGYATAIVGKWHLGLGDGKLDYNQLITPGPNALGFDYAFNMPATGDRVPTVYLENGRVVNLNPADPITVSYTHKVGNLPTLKEHPEMLRRPANTGQDGSIINGIARIGYMSGGTSALWQDQSLSDTFNAKAIEFIRNNKQRPFFLLYTAHEPHVPRDPNPRFVGRTGMGPRSDAVAQLDDEVERLMQTLREEGVDGNTLVLVTSDNGSYNVPSNDGHRPGSDVVHHPNGRLRGGKFTDYEGGVRMPTIARWPGRIRPGTVCDQIISLVDLPALAAALTHRSLAATDAPDSLDPLPALTKCAPTRDEVLLGNPPEDGGPLAARAIRSGPWKLILRPTAAEARSLDDRNVDDEPYPRLYDLRTDLGERRNVAGAHPEIVQRLRTAIESGSAAGFTRPGAKPAPVR